MYEDKLLPEEYVSIRMIWLKGIEECRKAISQMANIESSSDRKSLDVVGARTVTHTVDALYLSLVDHGEALIKSDVDKWRKEIFIPEQDKIWDRKTKDENSDNNQDDKYKNLSIEDKWWKSAYLSEGLYSKILQVLNKYGMLFEKQPIGYSNVIMEEICK